MTARAKTSHKILRNSAWFGLETAIEIVVFMASSIVVARYLGPAKLGYFSYINFFVTVFTRTAGQGVTLATRKYMLEYLGRNGQGVARAVYNLAFKYQLIGASVIALGGIALVLPFGEHGYRLMACLLLLSVLPGMMSWVPAQANAAFEDLAPNTISALAYLATYAVLIGCTVAFRWDLTGISIAVLAGRTVELAARIGPVNRRLRALPLGTVDPELTQRIRRFLLQGLGLQLITSVVWDRSELVFLRHMSTLEQTAFYSISFTFTNNLLTATRVLGSATGIAVMAEGSKDRERVQHLMSSSCRFLLLLTLPISLGAAAITLPAIRLAYGARYLPAVPVLITAAILGIPRSILSMPETLLRTADRQDRLLFWYVITSVVNLVLDFILIRRYAAVGAAWGNGLAQLFGVIVIWFSARRLFALRFPWSATFRITAASLLMAAAAWEVCRRLPSALGIAAGILTGCILFPLLLRVFRALEPSDRARLGLIANRLPGAAQSTLQILIDFVSPAMV